MTTTHDVTVLGCGLMGAALARTLAEGGRTVAVWNRTHQRAEALADDSVTPVRDVVEAVRAAPLVLVCLSTYGVARTCLEQAPDLTGVTVVNVGSGAPQEVESFGAWATGRGAHYVDGSILGYPDQIGTPEAAVLYAGRESVWSEHAETLKLLTPMSLWVSADVRVASVLNAGLVGMFLVPAVSAYVEASTYMLDQGVDASLLEMLTPAAFGSLQSETARVVTAIDRGVFATDQATIATYAEALESAGDVVAAAGLSPRVLAAAIENLNAAVDAGLGHLGFAAQAEVVRSP